MEIWLVASVTGDQILGSAQSDLAGLAFLPLWRKRTFAQNQDTAGSWIFFFNPGSAPLSYCRLKLESYLFFSSGNMFAVTLMLRNQINIAPSPKMWGRRNRNTNFLKVGASRMIQGEGHSQNNDKGRRRTKASYRTWRPASRFPNNPHKDSILQRRRVITHKTPNWPRTRARARARARFEAGQSGSWSCALAKPRAINGETKFLRDRDT